MGKGSKSSGGSLVYLALGAVAGIAISQIFSSQVKGVWEQIPVVNQLDNQFGGYANAYNAISLQGQHMSYN